MATPPAEKRRFRFGFRGLILFVAVAGLIVAMVANPIRQRRNAIYAIGMIGGQHSFKHWDDLAGKIPDGTEMNSLEPPGSRWLPWDVRLYLLSDVTSLHFQSWPDGQGAFSDARFSKIDVACLKPESIDFMDVPITDASLDRIVEIEGVEELSIWNGNITDAGVAKIAKMKKLKRLWLVKMPLTDACVAHLKTMKSLENLVLPDSVSDAAVEDLRRSLPGLKSFHR
jgi:hypothetical protein